MLDLGLPKPISVLPVPLSVLLIASVWQTWERRRDLWLVVFLPASVLLLVSIIMALQCSFILEVAVCSCNSHQMDPFSNFPALLQPVFCGSFRTTVPGGHCSLLRHLDLSHFGPLISATTAAALPLKNLNLSSAGTSNKLLCLVLPLALVTISYVSIVEPFL